MYLKRTKRFVKGIFPSLSRITKMARSADEQTYHYSEQRKGRWRIFIELVMWFIRHQEVNQYYYLYDFDLLNSRYSNDYGGNINQRALRNKLNRRYVIGKEATSYVGLAADKFVCGVYLESLGLPTPKIYALIDSSGVCYRDNLCSQMPLDSLLSHHGLRMVCKEVLGGCGHGFLTVDITDDGRLLLMDQDAKIDDLKKSLYGTHILQERIVQHPKLNELYPLAVMTLRIVTVLNNGKANFLAGTVRVGSGGGVVDNFHAGGLIGSVNMETGYLGRTFTPGPGRGGSVTHHPDTGVEFEKAQIPFVSEAMKLCLTAHQFFYGIHSIGWDIVFTEEGPKILEANDEWMMALVQFANGGLRHKFLQLCPDGVSY
jgi:hypothetical protein